MNKEQIINESYENYCKHFTGYDDIPKIDWFIQEIKTSKEFSERWGLKIEERELSLEERQKLYETTLGRLHFIPPTIDILDKENIPAKLITITYGDTKIESYE
jgi:uncharacterized HAD superfamily protein